MSTTGQVDKFTAITLLPHGQTREVEEVVACLAEAQEAEIQLQALTCEELSAAPAAPAGSADAALAAKDWKEVGEGRAHSKLADQERMTAC